MNRRGGFTLVEAVVAAGLMSVILLAGTMVFLAAQSMWSLTYTQIQIQDNLRQGLQRISAELQESGRDANGVLKVTVNDNAGVNATDILRFSIPLCLCGTSAIDTSGNVKTWGAPMAWGRTGCDGNYTTGANGKVDICHLPPGNPNNTQDMNVNVSSVKAHLAHGDRLGACNSCNPAVYNNRTVQYRTNAQSQLLREVLDGTNTVISSTIIADDIPQFQVSFIGGQDSMTLSITVVKKAVGNRLVSVTGTIDVILRNGS